MGSLTIYEINNVDQLNNLDDLIPLMVFDSQHMLCGNHLRSDIAFITNSFSIPPPYSMVLPVSERLNVNDLLRAWVVVDSESNISSFKLRKLSMLSPKLIVMADNPVLDILLLNPGSIASNIDLNPRLRLINNLFKYHEYVIDPLDPLQDNLDLEVYTQFEKDTVKYDLYENAIDLAISDLGPNVKLLIIGPGNGGIVKRAIKYTSNITMVEKNPKVISNLKQLFPNLRLIEGDIRDMNAPEYDIIVSEMIGSFGCNEMFPEVLNHMNSIIMIPSNVSTMISLINCPIARSTPYLSNMKQFYYLTDFQELWEYSYPGESSLNKHSTIEFQIEVSGTITAIKGIFDSNLYGPYNISCLNSLALPKESDQFGKYCNSWFPMIFPIDKVDVEEGNTVVVEFWRNTGEKVSYKWRVRVGSYDFSSNFV